jgi:hypothetical protein
MVLVGSIRPTLVNPTTLKRVFIVIVLLSLSSGCIGRKVHVTVVNRDADILRHVAVHVTGNSYDIGPIEPGKKVEVGVRATGESHIEISLVDVERSEKRLEVGCYFEAGYGGSILIEIDSREVLHIDDQISILSAYAPWERGATARAEI